MGTTSRHNSRGERRKIRVPGAGPPGSRKVVIDFPKPLFERTERAAAELAINRSALIRSAVDQYLEALHRKRLDEELAAGYAANAELDRRIAAEFSSVDYETF
jgi:metal-responsive CopG/Arc/MetJ family transcriptional regulator